MLISTCQLIKVFMTKQFPKALRMIVTGYDKLTKLLIMNMSLKINKTLKSKTNFLQLMGTSH